MFTQNDEKLIEKRGSLIEDVVKQKIGRAHV